MSLALRLLALGLGLLLTATACEDGESRMKARQAALDEARAAQKEKDEKAKSPAAQATSDRPAHPYWDDPGFVVIRHEGQCPEGLWALFPGRAPGGDDAARKENESRRAELAASLKEKTFVAKLRGPGEATLRDFDAPKGHIPVEVLGLVDCEDSVGRIAFAFTEPKAITPKPSALEEGNTLVQRIWTAPVQTFGVPMKGFGEAKAFAQKHQFGMEGYVVFRLGKVEVDRKLVKVKKVTQGEVTIGGTTDDFGAGRMVRADVQGVRLLAHPGPIVVVDTREPSAVTLR